MIDRNPTSEDYSPPTDQENGLFEHVFNAIAHGSLVMIGTSERETGKHVALLCGIGQTPKGNFLVPLARMLDEEEYSKLFPARLYAPDGTFLGDEPPRIIQI